MMLADYELSSSYSSLSSERARTCCIDSQYSGPLYDRLYLENVKITTTAERMKPVLITHSGMLANDHQRNVSQSNAIDEAFKLRYEARRRFFKSLEGQGTITTTQSNVLSRTEITSYGQDVSKQNSSVDPNQKSQLSFVKFCNAHLINTNEKKEVAKLDGEKDFNVTTCSMKLENIGQSCFVKVINIDKTDPSLHNAKMSCGNDEDRADEEREHHEEAEDRESVANIDSTKNESREYKKSDDLLDRTICTIKEQQQPTITTTTKEEKEISIFNCEKTFQDNNDNEKSFQSLSDLSCDNHDRHSVDYNEHDEVYSVKQGTDEADLYNKRTLNEKISDNATRFKLQEQSILSWIERSTHQNDFSHSKKSDLYECYCDDIAKMIEDIDVNIASSKTELDALPNTDTCFKYNLDSTNMSLIYSLTPSAVIDQERSINDDTSQDLAKHSSDWQSNSTRSDDSNVFGDYEWIEPVNVDELQCSREHRTSSVSSSSEPQPELENNSASSGSDILELPNCTVLELKDIDGEVFHNGINESANEIIANLNASHEASPLADAVQIAQCVIAEVIECVSFLSYLDSSIYDLTVVREVIRHLLDSYRYEHSLLMGDIPHPSQTYERFEPAVQKTTDSNDNICQMKGFLGNVSPDFHHSSQSEINLEREDRSPAVIEFCTIARKLPFATANDRTLEVNFRVVKVSTDKYTDTWPDTCRVVGTNNSTDSDLKNSSKTKYSKNVGTTESEMETWPCELCSYREEKKEESMEEQSRLTPISEESDEVPCKDIESSTSALLENSNDNSCHMEIIHFVNGNVTDPTRKIRSLDDTYTISEDSDNDETKDPKKQCDVWVSTEDYMSYSYDTKEFMRLEKVLSENC